jgi:hypothetical protein
MRLAGHSAGLGGPGHGARLLAGLFALDSYRTKVAHAEQDYYVCYLGDFDRSGRDAANSLKEKLDRFSEELLFNIIFETLAVTETQRHSANNGPHEFACELDAIGDLLEAVGSITICRTILISHGSTITTAAPSAVGNGLLDLVSRDLYPHTPCFFNQTSVAFSYEPHAAEPRQWLNFLDALWPQDAGAINLFAEWCG